MQDKDKPPLWACLLGLFASSIVNHFFVWLALFASLSGHQMWAGAFLVVAFYMKLDGILIVLQEKQVQNITVNIVPDDEPVLIEKETPQIEGDKK